MEQKITFLDTTVVKGDRFAKHSILDIKSHYKPTETFQFTHFASCHPPGVKYGFIKGEEIRLLRTNSSNKTFEEGLLKFKQRLKARGYPENIKQRSLAGVNFASRQSVIKNTQKSKGHERLLPFVTMYHLAVKTNVDGTLKSGKQSILAENNFFQNLRLSLTKSENPLKTCL